MTDPLHFFTTLWVPKGLAREREEELFRSAVDILQPECRRDGERRRGTTCSCGIAKLVLNRKPLPTHSPHSIDSGILSVSETVERTTS